MADNGDKDTTSLQTDLALIRKDVMQIERIFQKVDLAVEKMSEIHKSLAVQETMYFNSEKRISLIEQKIVKDSDTVSDFKKEVGNKLEDIRESEQKEREKKHQELLNSIEKLHKTFSDKTNDQERRIQTLENWRWYIIGIGVVVLLILNKIPFINLFG